MCHDELPFAVEGDISIVSVVAQFGHLSHELGAVKAHVTGILEF